MGAGSSRKRGVWIGGEYGFARASQGDSARELKHFTDRQEEHCRNRRHLVEEFGAVLANVCPTKAVHR